VKEPIMPAPHDVTRLQYPGRSGGGLCCIAVVAAGLAGPASAATSLADGPPALQPAVATEPGSSRSVLWAPLSQQPRLSVGVAVGQGPLPAGQVWSANPMSGAAFSGAQAGGQASMVVGVGLTSPRAGTGSTARLVVQAPLTRRADAAWTAPAQAVTTDPNGVPSRMRVGLVLRPADPLAELRGGTLTKVQLSGHMALSLRPRAGGVWLSLNGKW
jgi:hypothetical protein